MTVPFTDKNVTIAMAPSGAVFVRADRQRILQVVASLLNNTLQATPADGEMRVSLARTDTGASLLVSDTGKG